MSRPLCMAEADWTAWLALNGLVRATDESLASLLFMAAVIVGLAIVAFVVLPVLA